MKGRPRKSSCDALARASMVARSLRKDARAAGASANWPFGTRASPVRCRLVRSIPYHSICSSVAVGFHPPLTGSFIDASRLVQYCGSAMARCSATSLMLQLSGVIRKASCASDRPASSPTSQSSVISRWAMRRWRSPGVSGPAAAGAGPTRIVARNRRPTAVARVSMPQPKNGRSPGQRHWDEGWDERRAYGNGVATAFEPDAHSTPR